MKVRGTTYKGNFGLEIILCHVNNFVFIVWSILKGKKLSEYPGLKSFCDELYSKHIRSPFLLSLLVDMYEECIQPPVDDEHPDPNLTKALEVIVNA